MTNIPILQFDTWRYFSSSLLFQTKTEWSKQAWVREIKRLLNLSEGKLQLLVLFCFCPVSGLVAILCSFPRKWIIGCLKYCSWQFAASVTEVTARMHFKDLCINLLRSFLSRVHELDNLVFGFTALVNGTKWMNLWKVWDNMKAELNRRLVVHLAYALTCLINIYHVSWRHFILSLYRITRHCCCTISCVRRTLSRSAQQYIDRDEPGDDCQRNSYQSLVLSPDRWGRETVRGYHASRLPRTYGPGTC